MKQHLLAFLIISATPTHQLHAHGFFSALRNTVRQHKKDLLIISIGGVLACINIYQWHNNQKNHGEIKDIVHNSQHANHSLHTQQEKTIANLNQEIEMLKKVRDEQYNALHILATTIIKRQEVEMNPTTEQRRGLLRALFFAASELARSTGALLTLYADDKKSEN
jgi:hypothetical protein